MARSAGLTLALSVLLAAAAVTSTASAAPKAAKRSVRGPSATGYSQHVRRWHDREPGAVAPVDAQGRPKLVLEIINLRERVELEAGAEEGGFDADARARAARALRDTRGDAEHEIAPALLDLLYKIQRHFAAPCVRVISAYRKPRGARGSHHARGEAVDLVVPGVADRDVAVYVRSLGGTGVGLYPASGFVHVDVRESDHFWIDSSGPGKRARPKAGPRKPKRAPRRPPAAAVRAGRPAGG